jgi:hypothetical protein
VAAVLAILFLLMAGFVLGYGVREIISRQRRAAARRKRSRLHPNLTSDGATPSLPRDQWAPQSPASEVIAARANTRASS